MKTLSPTQQACLEAMGIDVWVSRSVDLAQPDKTEEPEQVVDMLGKPQDIQPDKINSEKLQTDVLIAEEPTAEETGRADSISLNWDTLKQTVSSCQSCALHTSRQQTVFGAGNENADWLIIGDGPTEQDDCSGQIFTGEQGELLTAMLRAIGLTRQQVYLTNTLKCLAPDKREPESASYAACSEYLKQQIRLLQPKLVLLLGQNAAQRLLGTHSTLARLRQKVHQLEGFNIPVVVSYHPASLLSMPANKRDAWQDLQFAYKTIAAEAVL